jgi:hypothetical protein
MPIKQARARSAQVVLGDFCHRYVSPNCHVAVQRTSISVNIKERLDFSCALFGPDGGLVANAPHIPVHLGAMQVGSVSTCATALRCESGTLGPCSPVCCAGTCTAVVGCMSSL